ncbi:poly(ADP-ribose) glycohydrolase [Fusarium tjaetaba]|uniref:poly(ADP-ribose) glycohydrolase n=1 Tax=Fusarium tjaetaba TaxID=1567544 RepID=A0A8H5RI09_9HYPO|nr:poly(ADP-ribose) glycohydrolase [Fusarium tjaetaba]KAF5633508.1 poly(ADP-ribose) glycohydrolase [Fusarium tjaetaba]
MSSRPQFFHLPNSASCRILDRFSDLPDDAEVEEDENGKIPFWPLLKHLLCTPVSSIAQLNDRLQTIAANAETCHDSDYGFLKRFLEGRGEADTLNTVWPKIRDVALALPTYFPDGKLELLQPGHPLHLSRGQVACLVAHQFLCSFTPQRDDDGYQDLGIWFSFEQRHLTAVHMYLEALFTYFESIPEAIALLEDHQVAPKMARGSVSYELHLGKPVSLETAKLAKLQVNLLDAHTSNTHNPEVQGEGGAAVVSSNKVIGFGQSATQEEIFVGIAPEAYPVVLVAPHLTDDTVITVSGARAMVDMKGQRRNIEWTIRPTPPSGDFGEWRKSWRGGRLVFMDALEMDMLEHSEDTGLPDLSHENIDRELNKAANGFSSYKGNSVFTGLWGCGAFGGDPGVKLLILWLAAGAADVELNLMLGPGEHDLGRKLEEVVRACQDLTATDVRELLSRVPRDLRGGGILGWVANEASGAQHDTY